jgi:anti-anti-sigma factor
MDDLLSVSIFDANGKAEVAVSGELDLGSRSTLESALWSVLTDSDAETITLNLADLTFCDGAGLHALAAAHRQGVVYGKTVVVANVRGVVARVFDVVQFGRVVPIQTSGDADAHP